MDIEPAKSATADATLAPGLYELACWAVGKNPDGTTYEHYDKGQTLTLAVTGPGGPGTSIATAANAINVAMQDGLNGSWILNPDTLVAIAGDVTEAEEIQELLRVAGIESELTTLDDEGLGVLVPEDKVEVSQDAIEALTEDDAVIPDP